MTIILALLCGVAIGLVLGGLGGGGSVLAVPALVYVLGEAPRDATTTSLVVVGIGAAVSLADHWRDRTVRWGTGLTFAVVGFGFAWAGTSLNGQVSDVVLLGSFAGLLVVSALAMLARGLGDRRRARADALQPVGATAQAPSVGGRRDHGVPAVAGRGGAGAEPDVALPPPALRRRVTARLAAVRWRRGLVVVVAAAVVGFLTGFLGVGGGFVVVPALVMALGLPMPVAAGTSLLVVALNSASALSVRVRDGLDLDLEVVLPFTAAVVLASFLGHRLARRLPGHTLTVVFALVLLAVAASVAGELAVSAGS